MFQELTKEMKELKGEKPQIEKHTPCNFRGLYHALSKPNSAWAGSLPSRICMAQ